MELVSLIMFPAVKPFIIAALENLLQWTLSHYRLEMFGSQYIKLNKRKYFPVLVDWREPA